jgi:transcriptional regulator with XRE-family HTH domain
MPRQPNKIDAHVGARIRMRRIELKISQSNLADVIGVSFQQVQKYEKATNRVGSGQLQAIANALDCQVSYFYENAPGKRGGGDTSEMTSFMTSPDGVAIAQAFESLPEDGALRRKVRDVIVGIAACQNAMGAKAPQRRAA